MADRQELSDEVKTYIVTQLASYETPSAVAAAVKEAFQIEVPRQNVEAYDPEKVAGKALSKAWRDLFCEARKLYLADTASIGIANKVYRLRALERLFNTFSGRNPVLAMNILEQAAKEEGGAFTSRREISGKLEVEDKTKPAVTPKQVVDELREIFGAALPAASPAVPRRNGPLVRKGAKRRGAKKPGASKAG
jgi:hypothetical protein